MKKLLVLFLVLGVASTASATPIIVGPDKIDISTGTITLTLEGTSNEASGEEFDPVGGYEGAVWVDYSLYTGQISNVGMPTSNMGGLAVIDLGYMDGTFNTGGGPILTAAPSGTEWDEATDVDAGAWFTFDVSALPGAEIGNTYDVQILTIAGFPWPVVYTHTVTVVPEPMTIALLGLGGLFLRRRKK